MLSTNVKLFPNVMRQFYLLTSLAIRYSHHFINNRHSMASIEGYETWDGALALEVWAAGITIESLNNELKND